MKKLFLVMLMIFVLPLSAFAEREKYVDKKFDFKKVKVVYVAYPIISAGVSDIKSIEISDIFVDTVIEKLEGIDFISPAIVKRKIKEDYRVEVEELAKEDLKKANELYYSAVSKYSDLAVFANIYSYGTGTTRVSEVKYKLPATANSTVFTPYGTAHVQTQYLETYSIPEHDANTLYVGVRFDVVETKDFNRVMSVIDSRGKVAEVFGSQKPDSMYKRILSTFLGELKVQVK